MGGRRPSTGWTCPRVSEKKVCGHHNVPRTRKCSKCGKPRPPRQRAKHERALDLSYEGYVEINGGVELCGICRRPPVRGIRLCRDHEHRAGGTPRGLLCPACNRTLVANRYGVKMTPEWLRAAADYLERAYRRAEAERLASSGVVD